MADFVKTHDFYEDENAPFRYQYARASLTADVVMFSVENRQLYVLLIKRNDNADAEAGRWALPGGFLRVYPSRQEPIIDYTIEACASRELQEETNWFETANLDLKLVGVFSKADRDERGRVVSVAYYDLNRKSVVEGGDDAQMAAWFLLDELPHDLAFDHRDIIIAAWKKLRADFQFDATAFRLLDKFFTYRQLFDLYYAIYSDVCGDYKDFVEHQRSNFINQIRKLNILDEFVGKTEEKTKRPGFAGKLYTFNEERYKIVAEEKKKQKGVHCFDLVGRD